MEREIKFRAWDKKYRCMYKGDLKTIIEKGFKYRQIKSISNIGGPMYTEPNISTEDLIRTESEDLVWLQFTGLYDKNDKDIYEGDIVKFDTYCDGPDDEGVIELVEFINGGFYPFVENYGDSSGVLYDICADNYEIIGNIYENPELLSGEK